MFATKTVHQVVSMFKELSPSNPECEVSQVDVEEWNDADEGTEVWHTVTYDDDLINAVISQDKENKKSSRMNLQIKKLPQRKFLWLKLPTCILHFRSLPKAIQVTWPRK
jgi:hypothetical protein